ncbi:hypothetical protein KFE25_010608 [Diacronema lutheri]|uniref:Glycerol kinase n=1 Tax=Diacronema lutheri TaxID=2081491 RepID=A0A8J6C7Y6_DIALT|nr:hypothetical protein KFE25_010608 [Diacronema lutheri]
MSAGLVLAVDVGTRSARACVFALDGTRRGAPAAEPIDVRHPPGAPHLYEQSSEQIWHAVCAAARRALASAGEGSASAVVGVGFDATCSLVVGPGQPVSPPAAAPHAEGEVVNDVILWLCHRAEAEADAINHTRHAALRTVGGHVSPEMQMPKLLWLKRYRPDSFAAARHFFDLADFLTFRATWHDGAAPCRSACTLGCKWNFGASSDGWDDNFLEAIGLAELAAEAHARIGPATPHALGAPVGNGLCASAADALGGLRVGIAVSAGAIDAHAGALGCLGSARALDRSAALISGTSTCVMHHAVAARVVPGVWGPYRDGAVPGFFLLEGGQSATGELVEHLVTAHPAVAELRAALAARGLADAPTSALLAELSARALAAAGCGSPAEYGRAALLTRSLHVYPDFAGNRSPLADSHMRGAVIGLSLDGHSVEALCALYVSALLALCCQLRHVLDEMSDGAGSPIEQLCCTGGLASDRLFLALLADASGREVVAVAEPNACLLGGGAHASVAEAMRAMTAPPAATIAPTCDPALRAFHAAKRRVYRRMLEDQRAYRELMDAAS